MQEDSPAGENIHKDLHILKLGYHSRANLLPLLYPLEAGWAAPQSPWEVQIVNAMPAALVDRMVDGTLDAALLPPVALAREGARISPLGGCGLASEGKSE